MARAPAPPQAISAGGWLRIAARLTAMVLLLAACVPFYYLWRVIGRHNPWPSRFLAGVAAIAGVKLRVTGERVTGGEFLLANHVSWIDVPALAAATGAAFVAHDGLAANPVLRWLCTMNDTVFIARHDRATIQRQIEQVRGAIRETGALTIFPEGTTSDGTALLPFKSALLSALDPLPEGVAVQPVLLDYGPDAAEIAWTGSEPGAANFLRILARRRPVDLCVRFLPPLSGAALTNRKSIAAAARETMLGELEARRSAYRVAL
jgi:lyso-ornithine lipid O-acyltransferase